MAWALGSSADEAQAVLRDMYAATRELNYDGVFVYQRGSQLDAMRLIHLRRGDLVQERLVSLSGPAREVIRDGARVTCLFADHGAAMREKGPPLELLNLGFNAPVETLLANYRFTLDGSDRVAGRPTDVVAVMPHTEDRYGYRLWIDHENRILLKSMILGRGGRVLEQMQFTQITVLEHLDESLLQPEIAGHGFTWRTDDEAAVDPAGDVAGTGGWTVRWLPTGFALHETHVQPTATSPSPVGQLVYSDAPMVTVFIEAMQADATPRRASARGAVNAFSRVSDDHQITVVNCPYRPCVRSPRP